MKLIVSKNSYSHNKYKVVKQLKGVDWSKVEALIYNSSIDEDLDVLLEVAKAKESVKKIIYISKDINALFYGLFAGLPSDIYSDESLLEVEDTLDFLVDEYGNTGMTLKTPVKDLGKISAFLTSLSSEDAEKVKKLITDGTLLKTVESSVTNVENALVRTNEANTNMVQIFNRTSEIISSLQEDVNETAKRLEELGKDLEERESRHNLSGSKTLKYPIYTAPSNISNILYIKVYSPCVYLNSFILSYLNYLKMEKKINSKFLLVAPNQKQYIIKYDKSGFTRLAPETIDIITTSNYSEFITFEPKTPVLNTFFNMKADLYVIIDMTYEDNLLRGPKVKMLSAVTTVKDITRFNLSALTTIIPARGTGNNIIIPDIKAYMNSSPADRLSLYLKKCKYESTTKLAAYDRLDTFIFGR